MNNMNTENLLKINANFVDEFIKTHYPDILDTKDEFQTKINSIKDCANLIEFDNINGLYNIFSILYTRIGQLSQEFSHAGINLNDENFIFTCLVNNMINVSIPFANTCLTAFEKNFCLYANKIDTSPTIINNLRYLHNDNSILNKEQKAILSSYLNKYITISNNLYNYRIKDHISESLVNYIKTFGIPDAGQEFWNEIINGLTKLGFNKLATDLENTLTPNSLGKDDGFGEL